MSLQSAGARAGSMVAGAGMLLTAAAYLVSAGSDVAPLLAAAGLLGCLGAFAGRRSGTTLVGAAAISQLAVPARPNPLGVLVVAVLLGATLAVGEAVDSGRWRAGWAEPVGAHLASVYLGVTSGAAAVAVGLAGPDSGVPATAAAVLAILAAAGCIGAAIARVHQPG